MVRSLLKAYTSSTTAVTEDVKRVPGYTGLADEECTAIWEEQKRRTDARRPISLRWSP